MPDAAFPPRRGPVLPRLVDLYAREGFTIASGIDAAMSQNRLSEFTFLFDANDSATGDLGISMKEVYFFECLLGGDWQPKRLFATGNSFGFSSFLMSMLAGPDARVVCLELGGDAFTSDWIDRSNAIAAREGLPLTVVRGRAPEDVGQVVADQFDGAPLDLVLLDDQHNAPHLLAEVRTFLPMMAPGGLLLCHDVVSFNMLDAIRAAIAEHPGVAGSLLYSTTSGLVVLHDDQWAPAAQLACRTFGDHEWARPMLQLFREGVEEPHI